MARFMHGGVIGGLLPASWSHGARQNKTTATVGARTISDVSFGNAVSGANRKWGLVLIWYTNDSTVSLSSMTIGGVSASLIYDTTQAAMTFTAALKAFAADISAVSGTGTVTWTDDTAANYNAHVLTGVNIDCSAVVDSAKGGGSSTVSLSIDCPAKGGVAAISNWLGGSVSAVSFANLATLNNATGVIGSGCGAATFASAQTSLDVSATNTGTSFSGAYALSFAGI